MTRNRIRNLAIHFAIPVAIATGGLVAGCASQGTPPAATATGSGPPGTTGLTQPAAAASPTAPRAPEAILADSIAATGGVAAWTAHKTVRAKIETVFQGMGMGGSGERTATSAGKSLVVSEMTGLGTIREGSNGKVFWSQDPLQGIRFLEGAEAEQARIDSAWSFELSAKELFTKLETRSEPGPDGTPLECVVGTPRAGAPMTSCYDPKTHLQVLLKGIRATPQGDLPYRSIARDWREVGGIKMAFEAESQVGPITMITRIKSVVFDEPVDEKIFEPPVPAKSAAR